MYPSSRFEYTPRNGEAPQPMIEAPEADDTVYRVVVWENKRTEHSTMCLIERVATHESGWIKRSKVAPAAPPPPEPQTTPQSATRSTTQPTPESEKAT